MKEEHDQRAVAYEFGEASFHISEEHYVEIHDNAYGLGRLYLDLLVEDCVLVETRAFPHLLTNEEVAQVMCDLPARI